ncbi:uncharacterized protein LOC143841688 [Paroedura picta]|uniref:uncharacterized protein LOC143841688 n=1 Tax=Paroedura picta TaxID=143630 RepID=UPI0040574D1A
MADPHANYKSSKTRPPSDKKFLHTPKLLSSSIGKAHYGRPPKQRFRVTWKMRRWKTRRPVIHGGGRPVMLLTGCNGSKTQSGGYQDIDAEPRGSEVWSGSLQEDETEKDRMEEKERDGEGRKASVLLEKTAALEDHCLPGSSSVLPFSRELKPETNTGGKGSTWLPPPCQVGGRVGRGGEWSNLPAGRPFTEANTSSTQQTEEKGRKGQISPIIGPHWKSAVYLLAAHFQGRCIRMTLNCSSRGWKTAALHCSLKTS